MLIQNAEIFAAGQWPGQGANGLTFTEADLDGIVSSFTSLDLKGRIPLKMGHDGEDARTSDTAPALGWVTALRRDGNKLLADIQLTSDKLAEMIKAGAYKFVSVELLRNVQAHTRQIPWVLDAVALLGATAPAVGILKDLQASMQFRARRSPLRGERLAFKRENVNPHGERHDMEQKDVEALVAKAVKDANDATTAKFTTEIAGLKGKLDTSEADAAKARAEAHRMAVMAPIENGMRDGLINGAAKDQFVKMNAVTDDTKVLLVKPAMAEEFVKDAAELARFKGPGAPKRKASAGAQEPSLTDMSTAAVVDFRIEERVIKIGGKLNDYPTLENARRHVLNTDPDLAKQYFASHSAQYVPPSAQ